MSSSRYVGRHATARRGPRPSLPALGGAGVGRTAAKSVAGVGIVLGCGAFVIAPTAAVDTADVRGALGAQQSSASDLLAERDAGEPAGSRSSERSAPAAVSAPSTAKGADQGSVGELDVDAVAKPEPKPKPEPESTPTATGDASPEAAAETEEAEETEETEETEEAEEADAPEETAPRDRSTEGTASRAQEREAPSASGSGGSGVDTGNHSAEAAELGLGPNAQQVYSAVRTEFPDMTDIGGYRAGDSGDHGSGRAVDIMVTGARGDQVAAWLQENAGELNITYVIWEQRIWHPGGGWEPMEDRGDPTQNHFDHVHVSVS